MSNRILTHPDRSGFQLARKCLLGDIRRIKAEIRAAERSVFSPEVRRLYAAELAARTNLVNLRRRFYGRPAVRRPWEGPLAGVEV